MGGGIRNAIWEAGLIVVLPLTFTRGYAEQFSTPKFFLTKLTIIAGLAVWALGRIWTPTQRQIRFPLGWPLVAFSLAVLVSCLASPVPRFSLMLDDPAVRAVSRSSDIIDWGVHQRWFAATLNATDRLLLVGERAESAVGVVRFDMSGHEAEISIYLVPGAHQKGEGS